jgi:hypothetical protein
LPISNPQLRADFLVSRRECGAIVVLKNGGANCYEKFRFADPPRWWIPEGMSAGGSSRGAAVGSAEAQIRREKPTA